MLELVVLVERHQQGPRLFARDHLSPKRAVRLDDLEHLFFDRPKVVLGAHLNSELNLHYIDINNGYDAFTLDNSRNSLADQPGEDNQQSYAIGLNNTYTGFDTFDVSLNLSAIDTELFYSFDEDWVCNDTNKPQLCAAGLHPDGYSSTDIYSRDRDDQALDLQFTGKAGNWVAGIYYQNRDVDLERQYTWLANPFASTYETNNIAAYGQLATAIGPKTTLITGLRVEQYQGDYTDSNGFITISYFLCFTTTSIFWASPFNNFSVFLFI